MISVYAWNPEGEKMRIKGTAFGVMLLCGFAMMMTSCTLTDRKENKDSKKELMKVEDSSQTIAEYRRFFERKGIKYVDVADVCKNYETQVEKVKKNYQSERFDFSNTKFRPIPTLNKLSVMIPVSDSDSMSEEKSIQTIRDWKEKEHYTSLDLDKNIKDASGQFPDENEDYPLVSSHINQFERGNSFFVNNKDCHIQIGGDGVYSQGDGAITHYLGDKKNIAFEATGGYDEGDNIVCEGYVDDIGDRSYDLIGKDATIAEGAQTVKQYFEKGTPDIMQGVQVDVPFCTVYKVGKKIFYGYAVRRMYQGVPFSWYWYGAMGPLSDTSNEGDIKIARVTTAGKVSSFVGYNEGQKLETIKEITQCIDLETAMEYFSQKMAPNLKFDVHWVEFQYVVGKNGEKTVILPSWGMEVENKTENVYMRLNINALTGDVYMYQYRWVEHDE